MLAPSPIATAPAYQRHRPELTALYAIVAEHYPRFLQEIERAGGHPPRFVSVDDHGRVVYRYKQPFRDGSTHVVLEPLDFMFRMNGMPRAHDCRDAGGRATQEQLPGDAHERPSPYSPPWCPDPG